MGEEKILLVDDDKRLLASMERIFRKRYKVETALRGDLALQKMETEGPFAVIICDLMMPRMNGIEFLKFATEKAPDSVHIMLSGHASLETALEALNQGLVYKFFTKPALQCELAEAIDEAIQEYHIKLANSGKVNLQQTFNVEENVVHEIEEASRNAEHEASRNLLEIQKKNRLVMNDLKNSTGQPSEYTLANFDSKTTAKVENIKKILGSSPETIAKIDILRLGKIASFAYENIENNQSQKYVIEIHFSTLYHKRYLEMYLRICRSLIGAVRKTLSLRIMDMPDDILPSRAADLIARIRPFTHSIFVDLSHIDNSEKYIQELSNTILTFGYNQLFASKTKPVDRRRLLTSLTHTRNKILLLDCEDHNFNRVKDMLKVNYYN